MLPGSGESDNGENSGTEYDDPGEVQGDDGMNYDYTVCDPVAFTLAQDMPEEIESATCVLPSQFYHIYKEDKLLSKANYMMVDTVSLKRWVYPY